MKSNAWKALMSAILVAASIVLPVAPADAAYLCFQASASARTCIAGENDSDPGLLGLDGYVDSCPLTYFGIKINTGYDYVLQIDMAGVGVNGIVEPGETVTAQVSMRQECLALAGGYSVNLRLESELNAPIQAKMNTNKFNYREEFSGRINSYCFTETCGENRWGFTFVIPKDFKRGVVTLKAVVEPNPSFRPGKPASEFTYSKIFTVERRLKSLSDAGVVQELMEIDGRILCWTSDPSAAGVSEFRIQKLEFQIVAYVRGGQKVIDRGTWTLGAPPNDFQTETMANGSSSTLILNDEVQHAFSFSEQTQGVAYGCQIRAVTDVGTTVWNAGKVVATRTVKAGVVQTLPNVKALCAKLNKTYQGGVALSSKSKNVGAKSKYKPKVSAATYQRNIILDTDGDGIACER